MKGVPNRKNCCKSCGAQIFWAKTKSDGPIALDREPSAFGTWHVNYKDEVLGTSEPYGHCWHKETCSARRRKAVAK